MPWTTGTTTNFANQAGGILGLLGKLLEWCASTGYEETIGTGNGSQTVFGFTLTNTTIAKGQCRVRYRISGVNYEVFENGEGSFVGEKITTGALDRATGIGSITFSSPVDNSYVIKALYTNASIEGRDWLILHQTTTKTNTGAEAYPGLLLQECILRNSGISYKDNVIVGIREWQQSANQRWGWNLNLYPRFLASDSGWNFSSYFHGRTTYGTSSNYTTHPCCYFKENETIKYWFIANKRRIIVIARTASTLYMSCYLGFGKRISTPGAYEKPNTVIGNNAGDLTFASTTLVDCTNIDATSYISMTISPSEIFLASTAINKGWTFAETRVMRKTTNSKVNIFPLFVSTIEAHPNRLLLFELDNIYKCPNEGIVAEDTLTIGGDTYLVVPNIYRSGFGDYLCVKLE